MELRLLNITSKGFMKLEDGEYPLQGSVGFIKGRNSQGKSSLLNIIRWAMGAKIGAGLSDPINVEEDEAKVMATFMNKAGEEYNLVIKFNRKESGYRTSAYIVTKEGAKISGQKKIREFLGNPPEAVDIMDVAKNQGSATGQLKNLNNLFKPVMGLDIEQQVTTLKELKVVAKDLNRDIKQVEGMFATHGLDPKDAAVPKEKVDTSEVAAKYEEVRKAKVVYDEALSFVGSWQSRKKKLDSDISMFKHQMNQDLNERMKENQQRIEFLKEQIRELEDKEIVEDPGLKRNHEASVLALEEASKKYSESEKVVADGEPDLDAADKALSEIHEKNSRIALVNQMVDEAKKLAKLKADSSINAQQQTEVLGTIKDAVAQATDKVKLPERFMLDVTDEGGAGIFYIDPDTGHTVPFNENQVATSQMLLGSLALTLASHDAVGKPLTFVTIKDASLLDKASMLAAIEMAEEYGFSVYPEIVTDDDGVSVEIFDSYEDAKNSI